MAEEQPLRDPWLVAAWPGLGGVAIIAATTLINQLRAGRVKAMPGEGFFELQHIDVRAGVAKTPRLPGGFFHEWKNPEPDGHDLLIFIGEAQPNTGAGRLCGEVLNYAKQRGVKRIVTFASLGTQLHPTQDSRVHAVATDREVLGELKRAGATPLKEGQIGGLNGVLLGVGEGRGLPGACLMAEIPYFAGGVPNPKAAKAALEVFNALADIHIDLSELGAQAEAVDQQLVELFERLKEASGGEAGIEGGPEFNIPEVDPEEPEEPQEKLDYAARARLERMFSEAQQDRSKAFELKKELDRLGVFEQYEDRFLDLFKRGE